MLNARESGVLLHPTSLPSAFQIGDLGPGAYTFVERLAQAHQSWWQILPVTPPGHGGSPYASTSAFASNIALIDPLDLQRRGLVSAQQVDALRAPFSDRALLERAARAKRALLEQAWATWSTQPEDPDFEQFCQREASWLDEWAAFAALKEDQDHAPWMRWPQPLKQRQPDALKEALERLAPRVRFERFVQWIFQQQWDALRAHARAHGVKLLGDIPIFVAMDSADAWAKRALFLFDARGVPSVVAGVPPDYFSATGQKWGNPLYDWPAHQQQDYAWWVQRVRRATQLVDVVRIDHFRGFEAYWEVPADAPTAETGRWVKGPGDELFVALERQLGEVPFVAEDLGLITQEVHDLRLRHNLPGMKVMHFAFGDYDNDPDHAFLPHTYPKHCVAYAGTHDNDTTRGWFDSLDPHTQHHVRTYLSSSNEDLVTNLLRRLLGSNANLVVLAAQDLFDLPTQARMNVPATANGNWSWRMSPQQLDDHEAWSALARHTQAAHRTGAPQ